MRTVVRLYDDWTTARQVVENLAQAGFNRNNINLVANDANQSFAQSLGGTNGGNKMAAEGAATGAVAGGALGGIGGLLLGLGALAIPGVGPVIAAGPIAAALTGAAVGAATGGIVGALTGWGIPEEEAGYYAEGVRRGGTLVAVRAEEFEVDRAMEIMNRFGPVDVQGRSSEWRSSGWTRFDPHGDAYTFTSNTYSTSNPTGQPGKGWATVEADPGDPTTGTTNTGRSGRGWATVEPDPADPTTGTTNAGRSGGGWATVEADPADPTTGATKTGRSGRGWTTTDTSLSDWNHYDTDWRTHYNQYYGSTGRAYDYYQPGYRYGYDLANDTRYRGRDWDLIEADVRRDWEATGQGAWEDFKDAIRHGWNEVKQAVR